jgi:hypothetical protein
MYTWRELVALYRLTDPSPPSNLQPRLGGLRRLGSLRYRCPMTNRLREIEIDEFKRHSLRRAQFLNF